jgi:hypothetical protein
VDVLTAEQVDKLTEEGGLELRASICGHCGRHTKVGYPMLEEVLCDRVRGCVADGNGQRPASEAVDASEQVGFAVRWWQRTNNVEMDMGKTRVWDWEMRWW